MQGVTFREGCVALLLPQTAETRKSSIQTPLPLLPVLLPFSHWIRLWIFSQRITAVPVWWPWETTEGNTMHYLPPSLVGTNFISNKSRVFIWSQRSFHKEFVNEIVNNNSHLLSPLDNSAREVRKQRKLSITKCKTNRFQNSFIIHTSSATLEKMQKKILGSLMWQRWLEHRQAS